MKVMEVMEVMKVGSVGVIPEGLTANSGVHHLHRFHHVHHRQRSGKLKGSERVLEFVYCVDRGLQAESFLATAYSPQPTVYFSSYIEGTNDVRTC